MKRIIIGNWKMNLSYAEALALAHGYVKAAETFHEGELYLAPSLLWLVPLKEELHPLPPNVRLCSQGVSQWSEGAYTGDVSAQQLKGHVSACLVGHSERRKYHGEKGAVIAEQIKQLLANEIKPIVCFGEMEQTKHAGASSQVLLDLKADLHGLASQEIGHCVFAYEPLWAIGTGHPASPETIKKVVTMVKDWFDEHYNERFPVLYGGSVTEENASDLGKLTVIDGLLVGGASLHVSGFSAICRKFLRSE